MISLISLRSFIYFSSLIKSTLNCKVI